MLKELGDTQAATFMHEMGHTLALHHGGADDYNCKPNYLSIMNYLYQFNGAGWVWKVPTIPDLSIRLRSNRPLDYSQPALPNLDKDALVEANGIGAPAGRRVLWPALNGVSLISPGGGWIDWDVNGVQNPGTLPGYRDINWKLNNGGCPADDPGAGSGILLKGYDDWSNLQFNFRISADFMTGGNIPPVMLNAQAILRESTSEEYLDSGLGDIDVDKDTHFKS